MANIPRLQRVAYLPCELKGRDLRSRLMIGSELIRRGITVVVGQVWAMWANIENAPCGCWLAATSNKIQAKQMRRIKAAGHIVIASDEEGLPFKDEAFLVNVDPEAVDACSAFLVSSESHRLAMLNRYPGIAVRVVGSTRVDSLRAAAPARPIPERYIVFNTSFGLVNTVWGDVARARKILNRGGGVTEAELDIRVAFETLVVKEMVPLIRWTAAALPQHIIVIRPHPSENPSTWRPMAGTNIRVVENSDALPWISHADLVVHSNSTTGFEAAIIGRPCLNIVPDQFAAWAAQFIMSSLNVTVGSSSQAANVIKAHFGGVADALQPKSVPEFLPDSASRIADVITDQLRESEPYSWMKNWIRFGSERPEYQASKFTASTEEFQSLLDNCVVISELDNSLVVLHPDHAAD